MPGGRRASPRSRDALFRAVVLGGLSLVGCGKSTAVSAPQEDGAADEPVIATRQPPREGPPPPPPPHEGRDASADDDASVDVPEIRRVVRGLLADELRHGRLGWAHLGWSLQHARSPARLRSLVASWLPALLEDTAAPVFEEARAHPERDVPRLLAHGHLGRDTAAAIYASALETIIIPGFAVLGIDVTHPTS